MSTWDELASVSLDNQEQYEILFTKTVSEIQRGVFALKVGEHEYEDYYMVIEENRMNSLFVHIVPKSLYALFKTMQQMKDTILGFTVLAGKQDGTDIRVSVFGVPCQDAGKALNLE